MNRFKFTLFGILLLSTFSLTAHADRGGVSGGGGGDGLRAELIDVNGDRSKLFIKCPEPQTIIECKDCEQAITREGTVNQIFIETMCSVAK